MFPQLENNEAILLMYLAGELPPADHATVEQMLQTDRALREQLAELVVANDTIAAALSHLDSSVADSRREAAVRSVSRALAAARAAQLAAASAITQPRRLPINFRQFLVPLAAAAALVAGILLWPSTIQMRGPVTPQYVVTDFPDVLAMDAQSHSDSDPLANLEQELLSLGDPAAGLDESWELTEEQPNP